MHAHVYHPAGKASIGLDGVVKNSGVPAAVVKIAVTWVLAHPDTVRDEWTRMNEERS